VVNSVGSARYVPRKTPKVQRSNSLQPKANGGFKVVSGHPSYEYGRRVSQAVSNLPRHPRAKSLQQLANGRYEVTHAPVDYQGPMLDQLDSVKNLVDTFSVSSSHLEKAKRRGLDFNMPDRASPRKKRTESGAFKDRVRAKVSEGLTRGDEKSRLLGEISKLNQRLDQQDKHLEERILADPVLSQLAAEFGKRAVIDQVRRGILKETPNRNLPEKIQFLAQGPYKSQAQTMAQRLNAKLDAFDTKYQPLSVEGELKQKMGSIFEQRMADEIAIGRDINKMKAEVLPQPDYKKLLAKHGITDSPEASFDTQLRCEKINRAMMRSAETKRKFRMPLLNRGERPQGLQLL
jgi:hypothetical protein